MSCICVIVDCNVCHWGSLVERHGRSLFGSLINSIIGFCNSHLALSMNNHLLVLAAAPNVEEKVLCDSSSLLHRSNMVKVIDAGLRKALQNLTGIMSDGATTTKFASTLSMSICCKDMCKSCLKRVYLCEFH